MKLINIFTLIAVTFLTFSHAFHYFVPENREVIYGWRAEIKAGTHSLVHYASQLVLEGEIRLQKSNGSVFVKLANLTHKVYNGVLDHVQENGVEGVSLPEEVQGLGNIFEIVYDDKGLVERIVTDAEEEVFQRNLKRAIAATFQIENSILSKEFTHPETFPVRENTVHDWVNVDYSIYPQNWGIEVLKIQDVSSHKYASLVTNAEFEHCDARSEELGTHESRKKYTLIKDNGGFVAQNISTGSKIIYQPFNAESDAQYVEISQSFKLCDVIEIGEEYQLGSEKLSTGLRYDQKGTDFINGRRSTIDYNEVIPRVQKLLQEIADYMKEININTENPDTQKGQLVNRVHNLLLQFSLEGLQQLQGNLEPNDTKIFYHVLPLIDTDASKLLIKDLVINKNVSDKTAVKLLQNIGNKALPAEHLLPELEELIRLNSSYSWEVRKVAILRFATLIHKSYLYNKEAEQYQKYVEEYVTKLRSSNDRRIQQVYIFGLRNMKIPSVLKYLEPAFNGEWWQDQHLRYLSLWAAASSDSEQLLEVLWPILINREEVTEMRILAYIHVMQTRPSLSRLMTLSNYMMTELDEEVYNFHYSYLEAVTRSQEPCLEELRHRLVEVLKTTPPPKSGSSAANYLGYRDSSFGFSTQFENYFIRTNSSRSYNTLWKSQQFGKYQEEYSIYLKIHDNEDVHFSLTNTIADTFLSDLGKSIENLNTSYLEGAVFKRGQVIDVFYFNQSSINEIFSFTKLFFKSATEFELMYFNYFQYHRVSVPTELGIPVQYEFLMPSVHHNTLKTTVSAKGFYTLKFSFDARLATSVHYRHGLSFYNPIRDAWQGVNRYQTFDAVFPMRFAITYSSLIEQIVNVTCETFGYAGGLRSFVKQVVFIRSDCGEEESQDVTLGDQYRHNYTLIDEDDPNTGLNLHIGAYDSTRRVSNGTFKHLLSLFGKTDTKQYVSPIDYLVSTGTNLLRYAILLPRSGSYGIVAKLESSRKFPVSSVDLSLRYSIFPLSTDITYAPSFYAAFVLLYSARNKDRNLNTWIAEGNMTIECEHTCGNATIELKRIISEQIDYKIYLNGSRQLSRGSLVGNYSISMGETGNETTIEISESGQRSRDQIEGNHIYGTCKYVVPYSCPYYYTQQCLVSRTTLRHYTYDVKTQNLTNEINENADGLFGYLLGYYHSYYTSQDSSDSDSLRIDLTFPMESSDEVDLQVTTPGKMFQFSGIPTSISKWFGLYPESAVYPKIFQLADDFGLRDRFVIYSDRRYSNGQIVPTPVSSNWTLIDNDSTCSEIFAKHLGNSKLGVKVNSCNRTLEVSPSQIYVDGEESTLEELYEDWLYYQILKTEYGASVVAFLPKDGIQIVYYTDRVQFTIVSQSSYLL